MAIGVAIIGSGIFAKEEHLPAIQATPALRLKAVYSRSMTSARSLAENLAEVTVYSDDSAQGRKFEDLLQRDDVSGVVIAYVDSPRLDTQPRLMILLMPLLDSRFWRNLLISKKPLQQASTSSQKNPSRKTSQPLTISSSGRRTPQTHQLSIAWLRTSAFWTPLSMLLGK